MAKAKGPNQKGGQQQKKKQQQNQQKKKNPQGGKQQQQQQQKTQQQNQKKEAGGKEEKKEKESLGGGGGGGGGNHPLEFEWTYWYDRPTPQGSFRNRDNERNYESNLKPVATFASVEDFWKVTNHMTKPSDLEVKANYHLFKKGIKPMWEHPDNAQGGKWTLEIQNSKELLDSFWENLIIGMIGETLEESDDICGAVVSRRKVADKISLWNRDMTDEETIMKIGNKLRELLPKDPELKLSYQTHQDSLRSGQSYSNPIRYTA